MQRTRLCDGTCESGWRIANSTKCIYSRIPMRQQDQEHKNKQNAHAHIMWKICQKISMPAPSISRIAKTFVSTVYPKPTTSTQQQPVQPQHNKRVICVVVPPGQRLPSQTCHARETPLNHVTQRYFQTHSPLFFLQV